MNFDPKYKKITCIILIIVVICLILTGIIVGKTVKQTEGEVSQYWFFEKSLEIGQPVSLNDAFVVSDGSGKISFLYDYTAYEVDGDLEEAFVGVANILVDGDKISKVSIKPDMIEETLCSYTENSISLENIGEMSRNGSLPIYQVIDGQVRQVEWSELVLGVSNISCILENGCVSAILVKDEVVPTDIRVLIKNGSSIFYPELYIQRVSDCVIVNVAATMTANNITSLDLSDEQGLVLCNSSGQATGSAYEGSFRVFKTESGFVLVNEVPMETYVKYVIPSEMSIDFGHEALKAQAVCARTFAYSQMNNQSYAMYGANLDDSTAFQVYHKSNRYAETDAAVDETSGEVISCNGELITCYYYSTSPGVTNDMSSWENINPDYLAIKGTEQLNSLDLSNNTDFTTFMRDAYETYDSASPFYRWKAVLNIEDVQESEHGALQSINVVERNAAGYVTNLELAYENATVNLKNENTIRNILGLYLQETILNNEAVKSNFTMIPSACFEVVEQTDGKIVLRGGGFGHGIGMSQYGAKAMAEAGYGYKDIIGYYYSNVVVKSILGIY